MNANRVPSEDIPDESSKGKKTIGVAASLLGAGLSILGAKALSHRHHTDTAADSLPGIVEPAGDELQRPSLREVIQGFSTSGSSSAVQSVQGRLAKQVSTIREAAEYSRVIQQLGFNESAETVQAYKDAKANAYDFANNNTEEILRLRALLDREKPFFTEGWVQGNSRYIGLNVYHGSEQIALLNGLDITNNTLDVELWGECDPLYYVRGVEGVSLTRIGEVIQEWDGLLNRYYLEEEAIRQQYSSGGHEEELSIALQALNNRYIELIEQFLIRYGRVRYGPERYGQPND